MMTRFVILNYGLDTAGTDSHTRTNTFLGGHSGFSTGPVTE